jgi:antitoxin ParD1/3/4
MPVRKTMNVSLTPELGRYVAERVATGRYNSASEVVRAALRSLEKEEKEGLCREPGNRGKTPGSAWDQAGWPRQRTSCWSGGISLWPGTLRRLPR